jgi:hypothetical protein
MSVDSGEQIGDVVLVALAFLGRGKVLVFGDTTPFQNVVLARSYPFVAGVFDYLSTPNSMPSMIRWPIIPVALLALLFLLPFTVKLRPSLLVVLLFSLAAGVATFIVAPGTGASNRAPLPKPLACIDTTHGNNFERTGWGEEGLSILFEWLGQEGILPLQVNGNFVEQLKSCSILFIIAPEFPFSRAEIESMRAFMEDGGLIVLTAGADKGHGARSVLREFGYWIENRPLGNAPVAQASWSSAPVTFSSAWPIYSAGGQDQILCTAWEYPLIRYRSVGRGGLIVIGDSGFLLNKNLGALNTFRKQNLSFITKLLKRHSEPEE